MRVSSLCAFLHYARFFTMCVSSLCAFLHYVRNSSLPESCSTGFEHAHYILTSYITLVSHHIGYMCTYIHCLWNVLVAACMRSMSSVCSACMYCCCWNKHTVPMTEAVTTTVNVLCRLWAVFISLWQTSSLGRTCCSGAEYVHMTLTSSCWGARESNRSVDMGLISSAIRKWNLAFCHEAASCCRMRPREAIHQSHAWSCLWDTGSDVPSARAPYCRK